MYHVTDFLNHGSMPFTGRAEELQLLHSFWRDTVDAGRLRVLLLRGEAGVGKSRLLELFMRQVTAEKGAVLHIKVRPDSANPLYSLLALAVAHSGVPAVRQMNELPTDPMEIMDEVRRVASVRVTVIVIEDVHLISGEAVQQFAAILTALADDVVSVVCATRPVTLPVIHAVEPYLIREIELKPFTKEETAKLIEGILGAASGEEIESGLFAATAGNPLAFRSALRGVIQRGGLTVTDDGVWRPGSGFGATVRRSSASFSEGLMAHLSDDEKRIAANIACLGETFSPPAAMLASGCTQDDIAGLVFKGIFSESVTATPPLYTDQAYVANFESHTNLSYPLSFTHSLVHRAMLEGYRIGTASVIAVLAQNLPVYTGIPFRILSERTDFEGIADDVLASAVNTILMTASSVSRAGESRHLADELLSYADHIVSTAPLDPDTVTRLTADVLDYTAVHEGMYGSKQESTEAVQVYLDFVSGLDDEKFGEHKLNAYTLNYTNGAAANYEGFLEYSRLADELVERFPELSSTERYVEHVFFSLSKAGVYGRVDIKRRCKGLLMGIADDPEQPERVRRYAVSQLCIVLLSQIETREEWERVTQEIPQVHRYLNENTVTVALGAYDVQCGRIKRAAELTRLQMQRTAAFSPRLSGVRLTDAMFRSILLSPDLQHVLGLISDTRDTLIRNDATEHLVNMQLKACVAAVIRGGNAWLGEVASEDVDRIQPFDVRILRAVATDRIAELPTEPYLKLIHEDLKTLLLYAQGESNNRVDAIESAQRVLNRGYIILWDIPSRYAAVRLIEYCTRTGRDIAKSLTAHIEQSLLELLDWMSGSDSLAYCMHALLEDYGMYLKESDRKLWSGRTTELTTEQFSKTQTASDIEEPPFHLSLIGSVVLRDERNELTVKIRGYRGKALLGLAAINHLLPHPMEREEFIRLSAEPGIDYKNARLAVNSALYRLRENIGEDIVVNEQDKPIMLDLKKVRVDVVEVFGYLQQARLSMKDHLLVRAALALEQALDLLDNNVVFPTLYEEVFENMREQFEHLVRNTTIATCTALAQNGETVKADELRRRALRFIPEDEELMGGV